MIVPMVARGRTLGAVSFISAESGRHYGPEDLELAKHLGRRAALAIDNARLYREAQEAISVRNELFSIISHDLKNPLTGIKGMAQLLKRQIARMEIPSKDRVIECLSSIDNTATRMTEQIDELLDLARLQMGRAGLPI
jgi:K+-sensing histidine kinase KdpD